MDVDYSIVRLLLKWVNEYWINGLTEMRLTIYVLTRKFSELTISLRKLGSEGMPASI